MFGMFLKPSLEIHSHVPLTNVKRCFSFLCYTSCKKLTKKLESFLDVGLFKNPSFLSVEQALSPF